MKKKTNMLKVLFRQLKLIGKRRKGFLYLVLVLNMIAGGLLPFLESLVPRFVINYVVAEADTQEAFRAIFFIIGTALLLAVVVEICDRIKFLHFIDMRMHEFYDLNGKYIKINYEHLEDPAFRDRYQTATSTLNNNSQGFEGLYHNFFALLPMIFTAGLLSVIIGIFQPLVLAACLIGGIIIVIVNREISKYVFKRRDDLSRAYRKKDYFYETCYNFAYGKDIRVFRLEEKLAEDYKRRSYDYITVVKQIANRRFSIGLFELLMLLLQDGLAFFFVIRAYFDQAISLGDVSFYIAAIIALSTALRGISGLLTEMNTNARLSDDYFDYLDDQSLFTLQGDRKAIPQEETLEIEFRNVSFKYPRTDRYIYKNFNFKIEKGERLAIVGVNGAGKSTLIKLITGLFPPTEGDIFVNGINIKEFSEEEYRKMFAVVFQEVNIYATSLLKNVIGTDRSEAAREKGIECLRLVGLERKIETLPKKYDTDMLKVIEEDGIELSGGENQKIAIARALYKGGNMVILDEPTAALDALAEAEIYQNFDQLIGGRTAIYVSHRLASTKFCDKIALFGPEGLLEYGSHEELMRLKGEYYNMFMTQGKYYQEEK